MTQHIKYIHFRPTGLDIAVPQYKRGRGVGNQSKGGITVSYTLSTPSAQNINTILSFAYAVCSKNDNYCKSVGRSVAGGRLKSDSKVFESQLPTNPSFLDLLHAVCEVLRQREKGLFVCQ
jgi:hypothetical protein